MFYDGWSTYKETAFTNNSFVWLEFSRAFLKVCGRTQTMCGQAKIIAVRGSHVLGKQMAKTSEAALNA